MDDDSSGRVLAKEKHAKFFKWFIDVMPSAHAEYDSSRMTIAYFAISGLDVLDSLDALSSEDKRRAIDWIYRLRVNDGGPSDGFQASTAVPLSAVDRRRGHLAMTYTSLATLLALGDDLAGVRPYRRNLALAVAACQRPEGCFSAIRGDGESDMRFLYCACCISSILDDWSGFDVDAAVSYVERAISYDGAMGQGPDLESHGGSTFCAVASLVLMNRLRDALSAERLERLTRWCVMRQNDGFNGRPGKPSDTCYSFWVGATMRLLGAAGFYDTRKNRDFVLSTQDPVSGGFGKFADAPADPIHTYLGLGGLSLAGEPGLMPMNAALNISERAYARMKEIHESWRLE